jgi:outer membrane protein assembly factor BamB
MMPHFSSGVIRSSPHLCSLCVLCAFVVSSPAGDWTHWRGPQQNGYSPETGLPASWSPDGENLAWKAPYGGRTTPIVMNGRVYLINDAKDPANPLTEQERVMCFDADTGNKLWEHRFNVFLTGIVSDRVGWTNICGDPETGNVYAHGVQGLLFCFDKDGKILWSHSMTEEYGRVSGYGGRTCSPIIDSDLLILGMVNASWGEQARGGNRFVAMDKKTGAIRWWSETPGRVKDTYYSTPVVAVINGQRLVISGGADGGVHAFQVRTGKHVWSYFFGTAAVNCSPVVDGNYVYIGHGEENPEGTQLGRVVCLDASEIKKGEPKLVWKRDGLKIKYASPIIHDGRLYVIDELTRIFCVDAKTGKTIWVHDYGRNCMGSAVLADGKLYVGEVNGKFHILKPGPQDCKELHEQEFDAKGQFDVEINGSPAVANGRVYFMTTEELYCIGLKTAKTPKASEAGLKRLGQTDLPQQPKAAQLQIVPADIVLAPGGSAKLTARLYDADGEYIGDAKPSWELAAMLPPPPLPNAPPAKGPPAAAPPVLKGTISESGELTVDKTPGQFGNVVAKLEGLTARCRVRVAPQLPYQQDFSKVPLERSPTGWVNTQGKFAVQTVGGKNVLGKLSLNASPLVARGHAYIGMPTLTDYTIESEMMGTKVRDEMPNMGVLANRYSLVLDGNKQMLRLLSWDALPRVDKSTSFSWDPNVWYRFKLTVDVHGDKALVKGKVWQADKSEPTDWSITFEDPVGNKEGSPALYGYATGILPGQKGSEVFYANVKVTPNKKGNGK